MNPIEDFKILPIPNIPPEIQEASEHGELVIFIGAGCSCLLGYPDWGKYSHEVLTQVLGESVANELKGLTPRVKLSIAIDMESGLKHPVMYEDILIAKDDEETNEKRRRLNNALLKLTNHFVTTNYDREIDNMLQRRGTKRGPIDVPSYCKSLPIPAKIILTPSECVFSSLSYKGDLVLHIHGSMEKPESMVQTLKDYVSLYHVSAGEKDNPDENAITYFLEQLFHANYTILFIGYGLNEMEILEYILEKSTKEENYRKTHNLFLLKGFDFNQIELAKYLSVYYKNHCGVELIPFFNKNSNYQLVNVLWAFASEIREYSYGLVNLGSLHAVLKNKTLPNREAEFARIMAESNYAEQMEGFESTIKEANPQSFFEHLHANKLFSIDHIPRLIKVKTEENSFSYRSKVWPAQEYLIMVSHCPNISKTIIDIISDISLYSTEHENEYDYTHIFAGFAAMYANMPLKMLTMKALNISNIWLKIKARNTSSINTIFKEVIPRFLKGKDVRKHKKACHLLKICTEMYWVQDENIKGRMAPKTYMEEYWFKEHICKMAKLFGQKAGIVAANIFLDRLTAASQREINGSLSLIWRPAIEDHPQNEHKDKIIGTLVVGLRDCLCGSIEKQREEAKLFLDKLLGNQSIIVRRVALSVIDSNWSMLKNMCDKVIKARLFEYYMRHETYLFLNNHFSSFSKEQQTQLLAKLSNINNEDTEDREREQFTFLHAIYNKGSKEADEWYLKLESKHKYAISEHPDFLTYMSTRWLKGTERSPYSSEDLLVFVSDHCLIDKLNAFVPNKDDGWRSPTIDNLATVLEKTIESNPVIFSPYINEFKKANVPFQYAVIKAIYNLWTKNTLDELQWQRIWEEMMSLFKSIIDNEEIWDYWEADSNKFNLTPQKGWLLNSVIDLLKAGVEKEEHAYPERFLSQGYYLLNKFLEKMQRNEYYPDTVEDINDVFGTAINSLEGKVFETLIYQLLLECRSANNDSDKIEVIWGKYRQLFENEFLLEHGPNYLFYNIFTCYFAHLNCYVDAAWTEEKLKIIFSETQDDKVFLCALDGLRCTHYTTDNFNLLKNTQIWNKSIELTIPDNNIREMIYEWLGLAYLTGIEKIEGTYFKKLYDRCDIEALSTITNLFYRENSNKEIVECLESILDFWRYTCVWLKSVQLENAYKLVSALCTLFIYLVRIDCENKEAFKFLMTQRQNNDFMTDFIWEEVSRLFEISENQDVIISTLQSIDLSGEIDYDNTIHYLVEKIGVKDRIVARKIAEKLGYSELYLKLSE